MIRKALFCIFILFAFVNSVFCETMVPLPSWLTSYDGFYKYQLAPRYTDWPGSYNNNCGPTVNAMILKYFLNEDLSTELNSSPSEARSYGCLSEARWKYCEANGLVGGYTNSDMGMNGDTRLTKVLNSKGLISQSYYGASNVTLQRIENAISQGKVVICHINPSKYVNTSTTSHWCLVIGYDDSNIIIHDPGYQAYHNKPIPRVNFLSALETANGGSNMIMITVSRLVSTGSAIKFTDSPKVYLYCNNQLWPILNETIYTLLGFRRGCSPLVADWSKLVVLPASSRANYTIRSAEIGYPGIPPYQKISYRITKASCYSANFDSTKLYVLLNEKGQAKFRHVIDWTSYTTILGYDANSRDIVDIPYDLFQFFGEGSPISSANAYTVVSASAVLSSNTVLEKNYSPILIPPYNLQADAIDNSRIQITWTLPNATGDYNIKVYNNGSLFRTLSWSDSTIISELSASSQYCFQLSLFDKISGTESTKSAEVCATTNANPPPPPINWTITNEIISTQIDNTYQPIDEKYSYEKSAGQYLNYWVKLNSSDSSLNFEWRLFYTYDNCRLWNAQTSANQPAYLCQNYKYYDSLNQKYYSWHKIEANSLAYIGQYRVELWINGQKASSRCFDLTMPKPDWLKLNGNPTKTSVPLFWTTLGDTNSNGDGVELFRDDTRIAFIPGISTGYTDTSPNPRGTHYYRIREVRVYPAGTFRSPFSEPLPVMVKLPKVTGIGIK